MPQVRTITTIVAAKDIKTEAQARMEFWERMATANGGREGNPEDYINIVSVTQDQRGFIIRYEVPAELLEQHAVSVIREEPEPNCQNVLKTANLAVQPSVQAVKPRPKCHVLSCLTSCIEGSSYCAEHQDKDARAAARGAPATTENVEPVFERFDREQPVPVKDVLITGWNPRKAFDADALQSLADDIRQNDLINAVTVRPKGKSKYELVAGERRLRAFRLLGRATIPAKVRELTDEQVLDIMLAENLQRVDLNPIEEAHHLKRVLEVGKLTQTELGKRVGKSQEWVANRLRLATAPATLQDEIIRRRINPSSAVDLLGWVNTEHFNGILGAILRELGDEETEISRARVREILGQITEPANDHHCNECGNSHDSGDGVRVVCAHHGVVNGTGRGCEKWIERQPRESAPDISVAPALNTEQPERPELCGQTPVVYTDVPTSADPPFVNSEDCKDCDIYDRENDKCPEGCTCDMECEDCFCERTDDDEDQDLPQELEPVVEPENEPAVQNEKNEGLMVTERPEDFFGNKGVPEIVDKHSRHGYHGRLIGSSNGDLQVETGERKKPYYEDLGAIVAKAIGCIEGDKVPIAVDVTRGTITIRRRGKF